MIKKIFALMSVLVLAGCNIQEPKKPPVEVKDTILTMALWMPQQDGTLKEMWSFQRIETQEFCHEYADVVNSAGKAGVFLATCKKPERR